MDRVSKHVTLTEYNGALYVDCYYRNSFPVIEFRFGGYWMELLPEDYILDDNNGQCFVCIFKEKKA